MTNKDENRLDINQNSLNVNSFNNNNNDNSLERHVNDNNNTENNGNNVKKVDLKIKVEFNCCLTPYFTVGGTLFFYYPNALKGLRPGKTVNLSIIPDAPFTLGPERKLSFFIFLLY